MKEEFKLSTSGKGMVLIEKYKCPECNLKFRTKLALKDHIKTHGLYYHKRKEMKV